MTEKNIVLNLGTKGTTENLITMYENAVVALSEYIEKYDSTTKVASEYTPAIPLKEIKSILYSENKYNPEQGTLFVITRKGPIPATPIEFFTISQLKLFLNWIVSSVSKEKQKLELIK